MATALITGASQGIGACIAKRLAKDGYHIAINHFPSDSDKANAEKVAEECRSFGVEAELFAANVADYAQCEAMTKAVKERFGSIDALVNNAGITKDGLMVRMSEEQYDAVIAVNQKSVFNMMKLVGAVMMRQRHGHIVSLASVAGLYGNPGQINYSASKAAIIGMTTSGSFNVLGNDGRCSIIGKEIGFENIGVDANIDTSTHGNEASFEFIVDKNPDYIFAMDRDAAIGTDGAQMAQEILENELVKSTDAYKNGHVVYLAHPNVWYTAEGGIQALSEMLSDLENALL